MILVSTSTVEITPKEQYLPCYVSGNQKKKKKTDKVHDRFEWTVIVLKINNKLMVWGEIDIIEIDFKLADIMRKSIEEKYNVPYDNIIIGTIHTHTGPETLEENAFGLDEIKVVPGYRKFLLEKFEEAVGNCFDKRFTEVTPYIRNTVIDGLYGNRNGKGKIEDKNILEIKFVDKNGNVVAGCFNIACHATVNDPLSLEMTTDIIGYIKRKIEKEWGVSPLMMQGASGDMGNRQYRKNAGFDEIERLGDAIIAQLKCSGEYKRVSLTDIKVDKYHYLDEFDKSNDVLNKLKIEITEDEAKLEKEENFDQRKLLISGLAFLKMQYNEKHVKNEFDASIIRLGDLEICQIPAELFSCFGLQIKAASKADYSIIWGYTNGMVGYLVKADEYETCYEGRSTNFRQGEPEKITEKLVELMEKGCN